MQNVSQEYKDSMNSLLRGRAYMRVVFGIVNTQAQDNAALVDDDNQAYYSNIETIFKSGANKEYATLEENYTKVDGSMYYLPPVPTSYYPILNTGFISENLVSESEIILHIDFPMPVDLKGLKIDFGDNYPTDFTISNGTDSFTYENDNYLFVSEDEWEETRELTLTFTAMKYSNNRLRIKSIVFGYGLIYYNDMIKDSKLVGSISTINENLPQISLSVTLINENDMFNIDNPYTVSNILNTATDVDVFYGYHLPVSDEIEWIKGTHLLVKDWHNDEEVMTVNCIDILQVVEGKYQKGTFTQSSYYDLAVSLLESVGIVDYFIDASLRSIYTTNPIPNVSYKEGLQLVANACCCTLTISRDGVVQIKKAVPDILFENANETYYSKLSNIGGEMSNKDEYATLEKRYTKVDGSMYYLPIVPTSYYPILNTGYVSEEFSDNNGNFSTNPVIRGTLGYDAEVLQIIRIEFGACVPSSFEVRTYFANTLVQTFTITEVTQIVYIKDNFEKFNAIEVEFFGTAEPFNRIVVNNINLVENQDFLMDNTNMLDVPVFKKHEMVKNLIVPYYSYQISSSLETLMDNQTVKIDEAGQTLTYYMTEPYGNYSPIKNSGSGYIVVQSYGAYYVTLQFTTTGTYNFNLTGYKYNKVEQQIIKKINDEGKDVTWDNPLLSNAQIASDVADWIGNYISSIGSYSYTTRGNPELDANDVIWQENPYVKDMRVRITDLELGFNGAFSGNVTVRREGE